MDKPVINGMFYAQKTTGVHRFAKEIVRELDNMISKDELVIVVPSYVKSIPNFKNFSIVKYGDTKGLLWEQIDLVKYLKMNHTTSISLCNTQPLRVPGIMCIHDVAYKTHPEFFKTFHGRLSVLWHRFNFFVAKRSKVPIITVSYFSKYSLIDTYHIDPKRIYVIGNGWQHMKRFTPDTQVLNRFNLKENNFYFTLGNINYNKNTKWVIDYAVNHPEATFVLSGIRVKNSNVNLKPMKNVKWLGYLTDEEITTLYKTCRAFIFPSIHEGFGIPPMEALSQGAKIIISNTTCLPEIYKGSAHYIDSYDINIDIEELIKEPVDSAAEVLSKYGWKQSAKKLKALIDTVDIKGKVSEKYEEYN